jgi:hypothetical protein
MPTLPPLMTRPLRSSTAVLVCTFGVVYLLFAKKQYCEAPLKRAGFLISSIFGNH